MFSFLAGLCCVLILSGLPSFAGTPSSGHQPLNLRHESSLPVIPLENQPFYPELVQRADLWLHTPLGQVVGDNPRDTLLNFYAVMADVGILIDEVTANHLNDPGLFWNRQTLLEMAEAEDLVDATWTGVQDVRAIVDVTHRDTGEHLGRAASAVAHDSGTTPTWGDRGRHGLIRVAVPASYPPESLRIIISLESQSYVAEHVDLGHAETDFFAPSTARVLQVDPRGTLSCRVGYTPPDPRHVPRAEFEEAVVAAQTITADSSPIAICFLASLPRWAFSEPCEQ